ncbi:DUF4262 domain-containing protein [Catellatospora citrea]|uniref:DUF4262 domain-containing protein n=1 Tax=Catellatospora citrea TaxID=53366 RepID=UPI0033D63FF3
MDDQPFFFDLDWVIRLASHAEATPDSGPCAEHPDGGCPGSLLWVSDETGVYLESNGLPAAEFGPGTSTRVYAHGWEPGSGRQDPDKPFEGGFVSSLHLQNGEEQATTLLERMRAGGARYMCLEVHGEDAIDIAFTSHTGPVRHPLSPQEAEQPCQKIIAQCRAAIAEGRFVVQQVHPDDKLPTTMVYTVGLTAAGQPELLIVGLAADVAHEVLSRIGSQIRTGQRQLSHGQVLTDAIEGYDMRVVQAEPPIPARLLPGVAYAVFGAPNVRLQQLAWPDKLHRYPWDRNFDRALVQPVIGRP